MSDRLINVEALLDLIDQLPLENLKENKKSAPAIINPEQIFKLLPKFEFTEQVGDPTTEDRKEFSTFITEISPGTTFLEDKIQELQTFCVQGPQKQENTSILLKRLMMLKILHNIIVKSSAQSAGLKAEAYLAGILGGKQVTYRSDLQAVDFMVSNIKYQLKVLKPGSSVNMSAQNLYNFFYPDRTVAQKSGAKKIAGKNLHFLIGFKNQVESETSISFYLKILTRAEFNSWFINNKTQNTFTISNEDLLKEKQIGEINVSKQIIQKWGEALDSQIRTVFAELANLINNVNLFYFENDNAAARNGINNCHNISGKLDKTTP